MATGANYPTSFDSYANKVTGDFLTVADVNSRSDAIEALESGPLRPSDGSVGAPAYSFQGDTDTGIYRAGANSLDFTAGGVRALNLASVASGVNFFSLLPAVAGAAPAITAAGTDTNVSMTFDTKGTGAHIFRRAGGGTEDARLALGLLLMGTSVISGANGGDMIMKTTNNLRSVNAAGTSCFALVGGDGGNRVLLGGDGNDVRFGAALTGLGGGASATLGTIGGTGPTAAAQSAWQRAVDSSGVPYWFPIWK